MKRKDLHALLFIAMLILLSSCGKQAFPTNGETIYKTGRNLQGEKLLDKTASRIKIARSCKTCHGKNGDAMGSVSVKFKYLASTDNFSAPYTDSLFFRFLDHDLKSNGKKANIGVVWKMNDKDKKDLLDYLKTL
jgi:cytochrome c553